MGHSVSKNQTMQRLTTFWRHKYTIRDLAGNVVHQMSDEEISSILRKKRYARTYRQEVQEAKYNALIERADRQVQQYYSDE